MPSLCLYACLAIGYRKMSKSPKLTLPTRVSALSLSPCCSDLLICHSHTYTVSSVKVGMMFFYMSLCIQTLNMLSLAHGRYSLNFSI